MRHAGQRHLRQGGIGEQMIDAGAEIDDGFQIGKSGQQPVRRQPDAGIGDVCRIADRVRPDAQLASLGVSAQGVHPFAGLRPVEGDEDCAHREAMLPQALAVESKPLQTDHRRAVMNCPGLERFERAVDRHAKRASVLVLMRSAGARRHLRCLDQRKEIEHVLVRYAGRRHQVEQRHQRSRRDAGFLLAFAPGGVGHIFAALDPPGRHLDQIALAQARDARRAETGGSARFRRARDRSAGSPRRARSARHRDRIVAPSSFTR